MALWRLVPVHLESRLWRLSSQRSPIIVRAFNEKHARDIASKAFHAVTLVSANGRWMATQSAWSSPILASCKKVDDARWPSAGPTEVVAIERPSSRAD
jgi:hypothetical protein